MKIISVFFTVFILLFAGGCALPQTAELNDRLIIEAVGIDRIPDGGVLVTVQALDSISPGSGENAYNSEKLTQTFSLTGRTAAEAMEKLPSVTGLLPLYSQARLLIFGRSAAEDPSDGLLDFFLREYTVRPDVCVAAAENTAEELLRADLGQNIIGAAEMEEILASGDNTGLTAAVPLYEFAAQTESENGCAYCQLLKLGNTSFPGEKQTVAPAGLLVFFGKEARSVISPEDTPVFLMLRGKAGKISLSFRGDGYSMTVRAIKNRTRIKTGTDNKGAPLYSTDCSLVCDITEYVPDDGTRLTEGTVRNAAQTLAEELTARAAKLLGDCYFGEGCDLCRYADRFRLSRPAYYKSLFDSGIKKTPPASAALTFSVSIRRTGREIPGE